jgi:hypothetical protein
LTCDPLTVKRHLLAILVRRTAVQTLRTPLVLRALQFGFYLSPNITRNREDEDDLNIRLSKRSVIPYSPILEISFPPRRLRGLCPDENPDAKHYRQGRHVGRRRKLFSEFQESEKKLGSGVLPASIIDPGREIIDFQHMTFGEGPSVLALGLHENSRCLSELECSQRGFSDRLPRSPSNWGFVRWCTGKRLAKH